MTKKEGIYFALGQIRANSKYGLGYRHIELGDILGDGYRDYEIGTSVYDQLITLYNTKKKWKEDMVYRVIEISSDFDVEQIADLLLAAMAYDKKN